MNLMPLQSKRTLTVIVHIQPYFDPEGRSVPAARKLVNDAKCGKILEFQMQTLDAFLVHHGVVEVKGDSTSYPLLVAAPFERVILVGGSYMLPPQLYPEWLREHSAYGVSLKHAGRCHFHAFVSLVWDIEDRLQEGSPKELHFCLDASYVSHRSSLDPRDGNLTVFHPPFQNEVLDQYREFLRTKRIAYDLYMGGERMVSAEKPKLALYVWRSVDDLLAVLPAVPAALAPTT